MSRLAVQKIKTSYQVYIDRKSERKNTEITVRSTIAMVQSITIVVVVIVDDDGALEARYFVLKCDDGIVENLYIGQ